MGEVCFYLKDIKAIEKTPIYLQFKYNGRKLKYYVGQSVDPDNWNLKRQRLRSNRETTSDGQHSLNDLLDALVKECKAAYHSEMKNGVPLPATLKKHLDTFIDQNEEETGQKKSKPTLYDLIGRFVSGDVKGKKGKERSQASLDNYNALKKHLAAFEQKYDYKIDFDTITLDFFETYTTYLKKHYTYKIGRSRKITGVAPNTIAKDISLLKALMNKAVTLGMHTNLAHKHEDFSYSEVETDAVYFKETELVDLFNFPIENKKLDETRDLFVFGSFTGLRFSDYSNVGTENIIEEEGDKYVKMNTQKTGELVFIPCHPIVLRIFEKYSDRANKMPKTISNQKFNQYIKEVCRTAGFTETGRLTTSPKTELWQCISSHTARRSFATNLFLDGYPTLEIMRVTGHKTEKAFMKYIRVSKLDTARRLSQHMKKRWSEKLLRVA